MCLIFEMFGKSNILKERKCHQLVFVKNFFNPLSKALSTYATSTNCLIQH